MKQVFIVLALIAPKLLVIQYGPDAPYGTIVSIGPLFIVIFLFITSPLTVKMNPYN